MELVFKISESPVRPSTFQKVESHNRFRIGRAFDNDLILNDPTISPHHAEITIDEEGRLWLSDLDSLNGSYQGRKQVTDQVELQSGIELTLGKTMLQLFSPDHPVESAVRIQPASTLTNWLANPLLLAGSVVMVALLYGTEQWLNMFQEFKWQDIINIELIIFGSALSIGIFWSIVGRIFKHEANFKSQMKIILAFIIIQFVVTKIIDIMLFNSLNYTFAMVLMLGIEFVLVAGLLWFNLQLATNQTLEQRLRTSVVISAALIALSIYSEVINQSEFSDSPQYVKLLHPPALRFTDGVEEEQFVADISVVFDKLENDNN
ncbi:MAG: FHA domain-containing protein [Gammaproteobacteria bacterium]|nr:FHA domain-containing protein [Gammaproteobacteria bacterium]